MKIKLAKFFTSLPLILLGLTLFTTPAQAAQLVWNGNFSTETRFSLRGGHKLTWLETNLTLQPEVTAPNAHFYSELHYRIHGLCSTDSLTETNQDQLEINEVFLDLYAFPWKAFDLRIGKQLIPWGTGYLLNPTSNLNPEDFRDVFAFGRSLGINALKATTYLGDFTLTGVYLPAFTPAALPTAQFRTLFTPALPDFSFPTNEPEVKTVFPANKPAGWGVKLEKALFGWDFSLSYIDGRYTLPVPKVTLIPQEGKMDFLCELVYPARKVLGFDLASAYGSLGFWGEIAVFFPEEVKSTTSMHGQEMEITTLEKKVYQKYLIGLDYSLGQFYANLQYLHGFPQEIGAEALGSYFVSSFEFTLPNDKFKIPLHTCLEVRDFKRFRENYALLCQPQLCFYPEVNTEIILSVRLISGCPSTNLGKLKDYDEISLNVKYSF